MIIAKKQKEKTRKKSIKRSKKIFLQLLNEFYKNSKCSSKYLKQKRRQKTKHLIDDSIFLCLQ